MKKMKVVSVNISREKGTIKKPVDEISLYEHGIMEDAHAGDWNRMVSLLAKESFERFAEYAGRMPDYGEFAENITTEGISLHTLNLLDRLHINDAILEVTQIGKKCHGDSCAIYREVGKCIMPTEGIFCRVVKSGNLKAGDNIILDKKVMKTLVITLSERASKGIYSDRSGPGITKLLTAHWNNNQQPHEIENILIGDDAEKLKKIIEKYRHETDFIFTTGGTGIGPKDITTDTVKPLLDLEVPGIMDYIRLKYG